MLGLKETILIGKIRKKDPEAFHQIYEHYADQIHRFVFFRLPNNGDCEDLVQEIFLGLWRYLTNEENEPVKNLRALIYKIARNLIARYYNQRETMTITKVVEMEEVTSEEGEGEPIKMAEEEFDIKLSIERIMVKMEKLNNQDYREILEMRFIDELSYNEIADILEKDVGTVRVLFHRALKKIKEEINK